MHSVSLPMYDWPELQSAHDAYYSGLCEHLKAAGFQPGRALLRGADIGAHWHSQDMLLSQTCGLPFVRHLQHSVSLLGTPMFDVQGCDAGFYASALLVHVDSDIQDFAQLQGSRAAVNGRESQSGCVALYHPVMRLGAAAPFFSEVQLSGSHRVSAARVADGSADVCAMDPVSWRLLCDWDAPVARSLRVLNWSDSVPALPLITSLKADSARLLALRGAVQAAFTDPNLARAREALYIGGLADLDAADYRIVAEGWQSVIEKGYIQQA